jgi:hypothetical protein
MPSTHPLLLLLLLLPSVELEQTVFHFYLNKPPTTILLFNNPHQPPSPPF